MHIRSWSSESEMLLKRLNRDGGKAVHHNLKIQKEISHRCKELIKADLLDIATTRYRKKKTNYLIICPPGVITIPKMDKGNFALHFERDVDYKE